jgi:4-hydroxybenzoate polyprenyltransferase
MAAGPLAISPNTARIVGAVCSAIFAGLAFYFPEHAAGFASLSAYIVGAVFHQRPGDVAGGQ